MTADMPTARCAKRTCPVRKFILTGILGVSMGILGAYLTQNKPAEEPSYIFETGGARGGTRGVGTEYAEAQDYNMADAELMAGILYAECRGESREGKIAVAQCILDRAADGRWGNTIKEVVSSRRQFAKPGKVTGELVGIAAAALTGEKFAPGHRILFFRRTKKIKDWWAPYICHIGNHAFYGLEG